MEWALNGVPELLKEHGLKTTGLVYPLSTYMGKQPGELKQLSRSWGVVVHSRLFVEPGNTGRSNGQLIFAPLTLGTLKGFLKKNPPLNPHETCGGGPLPLFLRVPLWYSLGDPSLSSQSLPANGVFPPKPSERSSRSNLAGVGDQQRRACWRATAPHCTGSWIPPAPSPSMLLWKRLYVNGPLLHLDLKAHTTALSWKQYVSYKGLNNRIISHISKILLIIYSFVQNHSVTAAWSLKSCARHSKATSLSPSPGQAALPSVPTQHCTPVEALSPSPQHALSQNLKCATSFT